MAAWARGSIRAPHSRSRSRFPPVAHVEIAFLLGEAENEERARALLRSYGKFPAINQSLDEVRAFWQETLGGVQIETPSPALDLMVNGWLAYQNLACRVWGRSAYYQSGGAFGFRDQLQDSAALLYLDPSLTRAQILLHASHQFVEGDVMHWWHPPTSKGIRTRFSDDLLWLPYITAFYVASTGDSSVLDALAPFVTGPHLEGLEDELFMVPARFGHRRKRVRALLPLDRPFAHRGRAWHSAHGQRRLERRHESRRARGERRERVARLFSLRDLERVHSAGRVAWR